MSALWELWVTDGAGVRQAAVDTFEKAEAVAKINDVSTWQLTLPSDTEAGRYLISESFARIEFVVDHEVWRSGPVAHIKRDRKIDGDNLEVTGVDDTVWLQRRNAHPEPGTPAPPWSTTAEYVVSGNLCQVLGYLVDANAGPGAVIQRRVPGLSVPIPGPVGPIVTVAARWQNLLTLMQDTAKPTDILFDVVDLTFRAYPSVNRGAIFSEGLETLGEWTVTADAPAANAIVVGGSGEGIARIYRQVNDEGSIALWGRAEGFNSQSSADPAALDQAGVQALASSIKPVTVTFVPLDTEGQMFGRDWRLGDTVTVHAGGLIVVDQIREVHVTLDEAGATIVPSVGSPSGDLSLFRALAGLDRRVRQLERK